MDAASFLRCWRQAISERKHQRTSPEYPLWEGDQVLKNLNEARLLNVALFEKDEELGFEGEQDWRAKSLIRELKQVVRAYEKHAGHIAEMSSNLADRVESLKKLAEGLRKEASRHEPKYSKQLETAAATCRAISSLLVKKREGAWRAPLSPWGSLVEPLGIRIPKPDKDMDLDGWFQRAIALHLRGFFQKGNGSQKVDLRTISRLVVLFYRCSGLAKYKWNSQSIRFRTAEALITVRTGGRLVRVSNVDRNLRRANID